MTTPQVAALLLAPIVALGLQAPTFRSTVELVRVDVLVTDDGHPVRDLHAGDFEVSDNGVRQQVTVTSTGDLPVRVLLALDLSESVDGDRLADLQAAGRMLVGTLRPGDRAGLLTFNHAVRLTENVTSSFDALDRSLDTAAAGGATSLFDALHLGMTVSALHDERSLLIVFSDGVDSSSWLTHEQVVDSVRRSPTVLYGVSAGRRRSTSRTLHDAVHAGGGRLIDIETTRDVGAEFVGLLDEFRQRYILSYTPAGVAAAGWHRLDVRVKRRGVEVRARSGYHRTSTGGSGGP